MNCGAPVCFSLRRPCESCARRARYGRLVVPILVMWETERDSYRGRTDQAAIVFIADARHFYLDALDALASVMEDRHRLIRQHRRELAEEIEAQRAGRDGYREGLHDSHRSDR